MAISTNGTVLTRLAGALYNTQMSNATYKEVAALDPSSLANVLYARDFNTVSDATVATTLVANLGLSTVAGLSNWVAAQLTAAGANKGAKVVELLNGFAQMSADATYGAAATAFNTKVDFALAMSQTTDNAGGAFGSISTAVAGKTFTLTSSTDVFPGTAGSDVFNGVIQANGATGTTIAPGDVVNGGSGDDTLSISVAGLLLTNDYTLSAVQTTGVEKVLVNNFDTDATLNNIVDTALMSGLTTVGLSASAATGDTAFSNMTAIVAAEMRNGSGDLTLTYGTAAVAGTADTQNLTLSAQTGGTFTAANVETLAINSDLSANTLAAITATSMTKLTVAGSANLKVTGALATKTIDASAATGVVNVTLTTADQSVTGGSGADIIDTVTMLTSADTINGGSGVDTLKMSVGNATVAVGTSAAKLALFNVSNVEVIDVASTLDTAVLNLDNTVGVTTLVAAANLRSVVVTGDTDNTAAEVVKYTLNGVARETASVSFTGTDAATEATLVGAAIALAINSIAGAPFVAVNAAGTVSVTAVTGEAVELAITAGTADTSTYGAQSAYGAVSFTNMAAGQVLDIFSAGAVTAELKDASGTTDAISVNFKTTSGDKGFDHGVGAVTLNNIETINVTTAGMTATKTTTVSTLSGSAVKELTLAGDSNLTISAFTGVTTLVTIDGSSATGDLNLAAAGAAKDQSIKTGLGNDTINMAAFLTAADTIDAGGNTIIAATGLMGKDTLTADVTSVIGTAGLLKIANVETLNLTNTGTATLDLANVTGASVIAVTGAAGTTTLNKLAAAATVSLGFADESGTAVTGTTTLALADATGAADAITVNLAEVTSNTLKTTGIETVNFAFNNTAAISEATTTITSTGLTAGKVVVTGAAADTGTVLALGTVNAATATVDASAYSGVLTMTANDLTNTTISIKTGNVNNAIVGGAGNDTVTIGTLVGDDAAGGTGTDILNATIKASLTEATTAFETINYTIDKNVQVTITAANTKGVDTATSFNLLGGDALTTLAMNFVSPDVLTTINMAGYTGKSTALTFAASQLAASLLQTITGGAGNDTITATTANNDAGVAAMTGIENLVLNVAGGASTFDFSKTTGLVKVSVDDDNTARTITLSKIADTTAVVVTTGTTGTTVVVDSATKSAADNSIKVTVGTTVNTVNLSISNIETLNLANTVGASTVDLSLVAMTAAGGTSKMIVTGDQILTIAATNAAITTIDASGMGVGGTVVQTGRSGNAASVYTGTDGNDTFIMKHSDDVITSGTGTDMLTVAAHLVLGGIQVNLNATGDQITTFNGSANAAVQSGFENINLSGITGTFGVDVTAKSTGSTIRGTTNADVITGGAGSDTITIANPGTIDFINGFGVSTTKDTLSFTLAGVGTIFTATATTNAATSAGATAVIQELSASAAQVVTSNVIVLVGTTFSGAAAVETAIEAGGTIVLTTLGATAAGNKYVVVWGDGVDSHVGLYTSSAAVNAATTLTAASGALVEIATLVGVTANVAGTLTAANFAFVA